VKTSKEVLDILRSIKDVRLDGEGELEVKFEGDWEANSGYNHNSFTEQLLLLIEDTLKGDVE
jgi:hypothetical protein